MDPGPGTFRWAAIFIVAGMILPGVVVALAPNPVVTSINYHLFLGLLALGFGVTAYSGLQWLELDRLTFLSATVVVPWIVFLTTTFIVIGLNSGDQIPQGPAADVVRTLWGDERVWGPSASGETAVAYPAVFMVAGILAVLLPQLLRRWLNELRSIDQ